MCRADNLTTCLEILEASKSWRPRGLSRPVMGQLYISQIYSNDMIVTVKLFFLHRVLPVNMNLHQSYCYTTLRILESYFSAAKVGQEKLPSAVKCCGYRILYQTVPKPLCEVNYVNKALSQHAVGTLIPYLEIVCLCSNIFGGCVRRHQAIRGEVATFSSL